MGLNFCSSTAIELMGTYHTTNLSMLLPLLITTALARFLLIGTMNPEEGELRPQFLDRFGLCVAVGSVTDLQARQTIVRRHLSFELDPVAFLREWEPEEQAMAHQIRLARARLETISLPDAVVARAVRLTHHLEVQGHRADLVLLKAARAHAALLEKQEADGQDLAETAPLALLHRMAASPLDAPERLRDRIVRAFLEMQDGAEPSVRAPEEALPVDDFEEMSAGMQVPGASAAGSIVLSFLKKKTVTP